MATRTRHKKKLLDNPFCIFCGGTEKSTTIEHMPNIGLFPKGIRPKGLEFPSCLACNQGTKWAEDTVAFIASVRFQSSEAQIEHFEKKLKHLINNHPDVIEAMEATALQKRSKSVPVDESGNLFGVYDLRAPLISHALVVYGAKLGIGLHWEQSNEAPSKRTKIVVRCYSNANALKDEIPQQMFELLPEIRTLRQGKIHSQETFEYGTGKTIDGSSTCHWAALGDALLYFIFVGDDLNTDNIPPEDILYPGCFSDSKPKIREWLPDLKEGEWFVRFP